MSTYITVIIALIASYELLVYYRAFLNAIIERSKYASFRDGIDHALHEHRLNLYASNHLFGTKTKTFFIKSLVLLSLLAMLWLIKLAPVGAVLFFAYWLGGVYIWHRASPDAAIKARLTLRQKLFFKAGVTLLWPLMKP